MMNNWDWDDGFHMSDEVYRIIEKRLFKVRMNDEVQISMFEKMVNQTIAWEQKMFFGWGSHTSSFKTSMISNIEPETLMKYHKNKPINVGTLTRPIPLDDYNKLNQYVYNDTHLKSQVWEESIEHKLSSFNLNHHMLRMLGITFNGTF